MYVKTVGKLDDIMELYQLIKNKELTVQMVKKGSGCWLTHHTSDSC